MVWRERINVEHGWLLLGCVVLLVAELFGQHAPPPPTPSPNQCGAVLRSGDVYIKCAVTENGTSKRENVRLTRTGDITTWGITPDGSLLAFTRGHGNSEAELAILDLRTGQIRESRQVDRRSRIDPTCGTLVLRDFWTQGNVHGYKFRDLVTGQELQVPSSTSDLRCSSNRRYTLQLQSFDELYLDSPQPTRLAKGVKYFNVSDDGEYVAYSQGDQLCAGTRERVQTGSASCLGMTWTAGPMVVLSDGSVLFTEQTSQACTFKISGMDHSDPCPAIFSWKPGDANDQLFSFDDSDPHVISFDMAQHVIEVSSKWRTEN